MPRAEENTNTCYVVNRTWGGASKAYMRPCTMCNHGRLLAGAEIGTEAPTRKGRFGLEVRQGDHPRQATSATSRLPSSRVVDFVSNGNSTHPPQADWPDTSSIAVRSTRLVDSPSGDLSACARCRRHPIFVTDVETVASLRYYSQAISSFSSTEEGHSLNVQLIELKSRTRV